MKLKALLERGRGRHCRAPGFRRGRPGRRRPANLIYWQAPSILNPYLSGGTKDLDCLLAS